MATPTQLLSQANSELTKVNQLIANLDIAKQNADTIKATIISLQQQLAASGEFTQAQLEPIQAVHTQILSLLDTAVTKSISVV